MQPKKSASASRRPGKSASASPKKKNGSKSFKNRRKRDGEVVDAGGPDAWVEPVVAEVVPEETKVKTESGSAAVAYEYVPYLDDPRKIDDQCVKMRWKQLEAALLPHARAMIKAGIHDIPGFRVQKEMKVKTRSY
jgi:hypothetical protein